MLCQRHALLRYRAVSNEVTNAARSTDMQEKHLDGPKTFSVFSQTLTRVYDHIWFCSPFPKRGRKGETPTLRTQASIPASHLCSFHDRNMHNRDMAQATVLQFQSTLKAAMWHKRYQGFQRTEHSE